MIHRLLHHLETILFFSISPFICLGECLGWLLQFSWCNLLSKNSLTASSTAPSGRVEWLWYSSRCQLLRQAFTVLILYILTELFSFSTFGKSPHSVCVYVGSTGSKHHRWGLKQALKHIPALGSSGVRRRPSSKSLLHFVILLIVERYWFPFSSSQGLF